MGTPLDVDRQMDGQTRVKTLPSRRTTYTGGNKKSSGLLIHESLTFETLIHLIVPYSFQLDDLSPKANYIHKLGSVQIL